MIIDCHGHYTTAPKPLRDYRQRQIDSLKDSSLTPKAPPVISDDQIRESLEGAQLKSMVPPHVAHRAPPEISGQSDLPLPQRAFYHGRHPGLIAVPDFGLVKGFPPTQFLHSGWRRGGPFPLGLFPGTRKGNEAPAI